MPVLGEVVRSSLSTSAMVFFILICAQPFALAFRGLGGERLVHEAFAVVPGGVDGQIMLLMLILFVLGFFLEWIEISYIALPMFIPIFAASGVEMSWIAILVAMNLQTSFLTPPFGWALFFLKGVAPPEITTLTIYRGSFHSLRSSLSALPWCLHFPA
jgi:TRAP-type mannitol/chloroaromatic compound transport system permease large subunit